MKTILYIILILCTFQVYGARLQKEEVYRAEFCNGTKQVTLRDRTRADCFKDGYAVEVDFADKWAEAIGQSTHYALVSNLKPMIALIIEKEADCKHVAKIVESIRHTYIYLLGEIVRIELRQTGPLRCITGTITP